MDTRVDRSTASTIKPFAIVIGELAKGLYPSQASQRAGGMHGATLRTMARTLDNTKWHR